MVEDGSYVRLTLAGVVTRVDHEEFRDKGVALLAENDWDKVLIDVTRLVHGMKTYDDYEFTSGHQTRLPLNLRIGIVHRTDQTERYKFIEDVAFNRGVGIRTYTDETEALIWLLDS
jgi:hypothetical protein